LNKYAVNSSVPAFYQDALNASHDNSIDSTPEGLEDDQRFDSSFQEQQRPAMDIGSSTQSSLKKRQQ